MKTSAAKTSDAKIQKRLFMIFVLVIITFVVGVKSTFGQRKQVIDEISMTEEPTVAFRYDGFENPIDAPAFVSLETLQNDEIDRKMEQYNPQGLPSMENVKKNPIIMIVLENLLGHLTKDDTQDLAFRHLIKDDTLGFLIKEEGDNETAALQHFDDTLVFLIKEDDGEQTT